MNNVEHFRANPDFMSHGDDDRTDRERGQILILDRYNTLQYNTLQYSTIQFYRFVLLYCIAVNLF